MVYACVRTDNMSGTVMGKDLVSLKYIPSDKEEAIENGSIVLIDNYMDGEREVRRCYNPSPTNLLSDCALIASEEVVKNKSYNALNEFINEPGAILRGYRLLSKDIFSVTKEAFVEGAALEVGAIVELTDTTKFNAVMSKTEGVTRVGKIRRIEGEWYVIEVA